VYCQELAKLQVGFLCFVFCSTINIVRSKGMPPPVYAKLL
jgi:hypothetical protein